MKRNSDPDLWVLLVIKAAAIEKPPPWFPLQEREREREIEIINNNNNNNNRDIKTRLSCRFRFFR